MNFLNKISFRDKTYFFGFLFLFWVLDFAFSQELLQNGKIIQLGANYFLVEGSIETTQKKTRVWLSPVQTTGGGQDQWVKKGDSLIFDFPKDLYSFEGYTPSEMIKSQAPSLAMEGISRVSAEDFLPASVARTGEFVVNNNGASFVIPYHPIEELAGGQIFVRGEFLGEGGINSVYAGKVYDSQLRPKEAVIKIPKSFEDTSVLLEMSNGHRRSMGLTGDGFIQTLAVGSFDLEKGKDLPFYILERGPPLDLSTYIDSKFPQGLYSALNGSDQGKRVEALKFLESADSQMMKIISRLEAKGLVHGDIKAPNILVETLPDGSFKLLLNDMDTLGEVGSVRNLGTPQYLPLEELMSGGGKKLLGSDQFAWKNTLYFSVFGNHIYDEIDPNYGRFLPLFLSDEGPTSHYQAFAGSLETAQQNWADLFSDLPNRGGKHAKMVSFSSAKSPTRPLIPKKIREIQREEVPSLKVKSSPLCRALETIPF